MTYRLAMDALGDPTRRAIVDRLRDGPRPVGELARGLPVSRPAVSQHLRVLRDAGLVTDRPEGRRRLYSLDPRGLVELRGWVEALWDRALAEFERASDAEWAEGGRSTGKGSGEPREKGGPT
jgi:DNA-binding transcriptional ArsR family regulator